MKALRALALVPLAWVAAAPPPASAPPPRLVFVSRAPLPADSGWVIPGLGPLGRGAGRGGRLYVREPDGRVRPLLAAHALDDVADPAVSWDGRRIAFSGRVHPDSAWRIWLVRADGGGLTAVTRTDRPLDPAALGADAARFARYDDYDPCWLPDGHLCFASTRFPLTVQGGATPVTNLYTVHADGSGLRRVTAERDGAEEPSVDPRNGRVIYARWFRNLQLASERATAGITTDPALAVPSDHVDLWHAITILPNGDFPQLAGGDARTRASQMAYQPVRLRDGSLLAVFAPSTTLDHATLPRLRRFPGGFAAPVAFPSTAGGPACAPVALPDGRVVFSMAAPGARDLSLWIASPDGSGARKLADRPGAHELDAAVLAPRRKPPIASAEADETAPLVPLAREAQLHDSENTFRFDCLNVFANAPVDVAIPDAPPMQPGVRIRFFAPLSRPAAAGGDTVVLIRETPVRTTGAVHQEDLPANTPMFEQLVDAHGHVLRSTGGPAHVPGMNFARFGGGTKCVGCHAGHSAIEVPESAFLGEWTNASPSADATASGVRAGTAGPRAAVDRRAKGNASEVAWIADSTNGAWLRLSWRWPIEVRAVVLYACAARVSDHTDLRVTRSELVFLRAGREVRRIPVGTTLAPSGTRVTTEPVIVDALEVRPLRVSGRVSGRPGAAIAEIETVARFVGE